jgi:hypothetical protein
LDGWALDCPEGAVNTAVTWLGSQDDAAFPTVIKKLTCVLWHLFTFCVATLGTSDIGKFNKFNQ